MIQDQLVGYISSQVKLGIAKDAVRASLVAAGWSAADVDDTIKSVEGSPASQGTLAEGKPAAAGPALRVSDLISTPDTVKTFGATPAAASPVAQAMPTKAAQPAAAAKPVAPITAKPATSIPSVPPGAESFEAEMPVKMGGGGGGLVMKIVPWALVAVFAGGAGFFFFQNQGLAGKVAMLTTQSSGISTQLSELKSGLNASTTALAAQVGDLTTQLTRLKTELSFFVLPPGTQPGTSVKASLMGTVSGGGKSLYAITTAEGVRVTVGNSKDAKVVSYLQPLIGTSADISITYVPGLLSATVIPPEPAASVPAATTTTTTTATSTATSTSTK